MADTITYREYQELKHDNPVAAARAAREGRVTGMPRDLKRMHANSVRDQGNSLKRLGSAVAEMEARRTAPDTEED